MSRNCFLFFLLTACLVAGFKTSSVTLELEENKKDSETFKVKLFLNFLTHEIVKPSLTSADMEFLNFKVCIFSNNSKH